jgi:hypothetical protein
MIFGNLILWLMASSCSNGWRHVEITSPPHSGTAFYNCKQIFSILLSGVVDANYEFIFANAGIQGSISDGGAFK